MGIGKRALLSVVRQPVKSLILLATVAILCTLIAGAVSVKQGLLAMQKVIGDEMHITATVQPIAEGQPGNDRDDLLAVPEIGDKTTEKITALSQIKSYEITRQIPLFSSKILSSQMGMGTGRKVYARAVAAKDGHLLDYEMGNISLSNGRWLTSEDENSPFNPVVISDTLANDNRMTVGSQFTMECTSGPSDVNEAEVTFTVIGTYRDVKKYSISNGVFTSGDNMVYFYTSQHTGQSIMGIADDFVAKNRDKGVNSTYGIQHISLWLKDRQSVDAFSDGIGAVGLPKSYRVAMSTGAYDRTMSPLKNLDFIVNLIIAASVFATVSILGFVIALVLRGRKSEIGTFFSLGERKKRIAKQVVAEVLIIAAIGITVSVVIGTNLSGWLSNQLLQKEVSTFMQSGGTSATTVDAAALHSMTEGVEVTLGGDTVALIYLVGLLTAGISSILPVVFTLRLNPKNILMEGE